MSGGGAVVECSDQGVALAVGKPVRLEAVGGQADALVLGDQGGIGGVDGVLPHGSAEVREEAQLVALDVRECRQAGLGCRRGIEGEPLLQVVDRHEVLAITHVEPAPQPDPPGGHVQADRIGRHIARPVRRHDHVPPRLRAGGAASDVVLQLLVHVEHVHHVVAVADVGNREHAGPIQIHDGAHVERVVVGRGHVARGRCRQTGGPPDPVERCAVTRSRQWLGNVSVFTADTLHPHERVAPKERGKTEVVGVALQAVGDQLRSHHRFQ